MILGFEHTVQLSVFVKSVGAGYIIGLIFFMLMLMNCFFGKHTYSVFIRDVLFFLTAAVFTVIFLLKYNAGIIRFYILCGELMGFILFYIFPASVITPKVRVFAVALKEKIKRKTEGCRKVYNESKLNIKKRFADKTDKRKRKISSFSAKIKNKRVNMTKKNKNN